MTRLTVGKTGAGIATLCALGCGEPAGPQETVHRTSISSNETWTRAASPHVVQGLVHVGGGATLTIEAGATVIFKPLGSLTFGGVGSGSLQANGTAAEPITMRGEDTATTPWIGIAFRGSAVSEMHYVNVSDCGRDYIPDSLPPACILLGKPLTSDAPSLLIDHVTVSDGVEVAILAKNGSSFADGSTTLSVSNMRGHIATVPADEATRFPRGGSFTANDSNEVRLTVDTVRASATWTGDVPWNVIGPVSIEGNAQPVLTIPAGTTLRMTGAIIVGKNLPGGLRIGSDGGATVTLRSAGSSRWAGVDFSAHAVNSSITNAVLEHCGSYQEGRTSGGCVSIAGRWDDSSDIAPEPVLKNVTVRDAIDAGIVLSYGGKFGAGSSNLTITGTVGTGGGFGTGSPLVVFQSSFGSIPPGQYTGNARDWIWTYELELRQDDTWRKHDVPYVIYAFLSIGDSITHPTVTIEPGVTVILDVAAKLQVGWDAPGVLHAVGTATQPITFTGVVATPGSWAGVVIGPHADTASRFDHVLVEYGGAPYPVAGSYHFYKDIGPVIRNSVIRHSAGCGVIIVNQPPWFTDFTAPALANTFSNNAGGSICGP